MPSFRVVESLQIELNGIFETGPICPAAIGKRLDGTASGDEQDASLLHLEVNNKVILAIQQSGDQDCVFLLRTRNWPSQHLSCIFAPNIEFSGEGKHCESFRASLEVHQFGLSGGHRYLFGLEDDLLPIEVQFVAGLGSCTFPTQRASRQASQLANSYCQRRPL